MLNKREEKPGPLALMMREPGELRARVERIGSFQKLKNLVEAAELLPGTRLTATDNAFRMLQEKILYCLRVNGATPFLAGLPPEIAKAMTMEFANVIETFIPDADQREKLIAGEIKLAELPKAEESIRQEIINCDTKIKQILLPGPKSKGD
jgi:hypothetical protein